MRQTRLLLAAAVAVVLLAAATACGDDGHDLEGRSVTVGVAEDYPPFSYTLPGEADGQGWDYDIWREICGMLNCEPEFVVASWPELLDQVAEGEIDAGADGITITEERSELVAFSDPYMTVDQKFIVAADDRRFSTAAELIASEAVVGGQTGTTNYDLAVDLVGAERVRAFDESSGGVGEAGGSFEALIAGEIDAVIIDDSSGLGYVGADAEAVRLIDDSLRADSLGFAFELGSDLVEPVNHALAEMRSSGLLETLARRWFSGDLELGDS